MGKELGDFGDISVVGAGSKPAPLPAPKPPAPFVNAPSPPILTPNQYREIMQNTWNDLPNHIPNIALDAFVIMPNHIHGIIRIIEHDANRAGLEHRAGLEPAPTVGLPEMVRQLKTFSARRINKQRNTFGQPVWQRNYYEHIICDEKSLCFIRKYIRENPANWRNDMENHIDKEILDLEMSEIEDAK
jgi:REP element-mobilizing transposase RayT